MSAATSPGTGLAYGLQRVCAAWSFARSSFYAMQSRQQAGDEQILDGRLRKHAVEDHRQTRR